MCLHLKKKEQCVLFLLLYVDDIIIASSSMDEISTLKERLSLEFEMKDLGIARRILRMDIVRNLMTGELFLSQQGYLKKIMERFRMHQSKPVSTLWDITLRSQLLKFLILKRKEGRWILFHMLLE